MRKSTRRQEMDRIERKSSYIIQKIKDSKNNIKMTKDFPLVTTENTRILIVDDDQGMRDMLLSVLPIFGFEAIAARNGSEAIALFLTNPFDLVITDLQMPGMDGRSLAFNIKRIFPEIPIIMMTAQAKAYVAKDLKNSCFESALFKPFKLEQLQQEIQRVLGGLPRDKIH